MRVGWQSGACDCAHFHRKIFRDNFGFEGLLTSMNRWEEITMTVEASSYYYSECATQGFNQPRNFPARFEDPKIQDAA
jgi:hypothetical protein